MTTAYLDPNVAVNALWNDSTVTKIDDASRSPTAPSTGEYCKADKNDFSEEQIWGFSGSSLTNINITQIKLICYGLSTGSEGADARVKVNGSWLASTFILNSASNAFYELTWNGTWNNQDANNLQMGFTSDATTDEVHIEEAYLLITYTVAGSSAVVLCGVTSFLTGQGSGISEMTRVIKKDSTSQSIELFIIDSTTGLGKTGLVYNSSGMDLWYRRSGATVTSITEATLAAANTAWSGGGFKELGNGVYRLDPPDAAFATGVPEVVFCGACTGCMVLPTLVQLVDYDPQDAVALGVSRLDAAISSRSTLTAAGVWDALLSTISTASSVGKLLKDNIDAVLSAIKTKTDLIPASPAAVGSAMTLSDGAITSAKFAAGAIDSTAIAADAIGASELASDAVTEIVNGIWNETQSGHTTAGTFGKYLDSQVSTISGGSGLDAAGVRTAIGLGSANLDTQLATLPTWTKLKKWLQLLFRKDSAIATDNATELGEINADGGSGAGGYVSTTDSIEALRDRGDAAWTTGSGGLDAAGIRTAIGLASADLDTQFTGIKTKTDNLPASPAAVGSEMGLADGAITSAKFAAGAIDAAAIATDAFGALEVAAGAASEIATAVRTELTTELGRIDTPVSGVKTVTDNLATAIELDGSVYRFTTNALEQAPSPASLTITELTSTPGASPTFAQVMAFVYMQFRNKFTVTKDLRTMHNDAGDPVMEQAIDDDGTTFTRDQWEDVP